MLFRKMLRDLKENKTQFLSIFLMAFLSIFVYAGIGAEWHGLHDTMYELYEETDFADVWLYGNNFSKQEMNDIKDISDVKDTQRRMIFEGTLDLKNDPVLAIHLPDEYKLSRNYVKNGIDYDETKDGIWLDQLFAVENNFSVGDTIKFSALGMDFETEILGTVLNGETIYDYNSGEMIPDHQAYGFAYISPAALPDEFEPVYTAMLLTLNEEVPAEDLEDKISDAINGSYSVYLERENHPSHMMITDEVEQHKTMANIFPFVFLAIAMLTILTTMTRIVNNQRTQIGTLKALGYKRRSIIWHFVSYGFLVAAAGSFLGAVIGPLTLPKLFYSAMQTTFNLQKWTSVFAPSFFVVALISSLVCGLFTFLACRNQLKDTPAATLRPKSPKTMKRNIFEKSKYWTRLGFNMQWNLRDVFRNKTRSLMAVTGVVGCMALLICAFGMRDSFDDIIAWQYDDLINYESKLTMEESASYKDAEKVKTKTDGEMIQEGNIEIRANDLKKNGDLLVYEDLNLMSFTAPDREEMTLPRDGLAISYKLADVLGVGEGDEIEWHVYGEEGWKKSRIDSIYRSPVSQGITVSKEYFEEKDYEFLPTSIVTNETVKTPPDHVASTFTITTLKENFDIMIEAMHVMIYVLIVAACLLAVVVLYNLGVLSFTERQRELATLKVLGFKSGKIRKLLLTQTALLSFIGILVGILAGNVLLDFLIHTVSESFDMMTQISGFTYAVSIGISFILSVLVTFVFSRNVKKIDMVSSLKGVE